LKKYFLILFIFTVGLYFGKLLPNKTEYIQLNYTTEFPKLVELLSFLDYNYVDKIDLDSLQEEIISATLESLDPHSTYINVDEIKSVTEGMQGNFEGIGVEFQIQHDTIVVVSPISGGPSERQGILSGDRIVKVDTLNVAGVGFTNADVVDNLRGAKGTKVNLTIKRPSRNKLLEFKITRAKIPLTSVDVSYIIEDKIGYIKVNRFSGTTDQEFIESIDKLKSKGMQSLILDLRSNPGGYLHAAIAMVDEFLEQGEIVYTQGNARRKKVYEATKYGAFKQQEIVVLVDEGSASASEIVAGALQDHDRAYIVGRRTFGKGLVQEQTQMSDGSAFRLTTARYYTPSGRSIQKAYTKDVEAYHLESANRYENGELYSEDSIKIADSLKFFTSNGRVVYGGGGITPDIIIERDSTVNYLQINKMISKGWVNEFCFEKSEHLQKQNIKDYNSIDMQQVYADFLSFIKQKDNTFELKIGTIETTYLDNLLLATISRNLWDNDTYYKVLSLEDEYIQRAIKEF